MLSPRATATRRTLREVDLLQQLHHPYVIELKLATMLSSTTPPKILVVMEWLPYNLRELVQRHRPKGLSSESVKAILHQLLSALSFVHRTGVVMRTLTCAPPGSEAALISPRSRVLPDLVCIILRRNRRTSMKPAFAARRKGAASSMPLGRAPWPILSARPARRSARRILYDPRQGLVKLGDFINARNIAEHEHGSGRTLTTYNQCWSGCAPELLLGGAAGSHRAGVQGQTAQVQYSYPIDVWAAGCVLVEVVSGLPAFDADSEVDLLYKMFQLCGTPTELTWPGIDGMSNIVTIACSAPSSIAWPKWAGTGVATRFSDLPADAINLLERMLVLNPTDRITATDCLTHPFFDFDPQLARRKLLSEMAP